MNDPVFVAVGRDEGRVHILFAKDPECTQPMSVDRWVLDAEECLQIAEAMAQAAFESRDNVKPVGEALKAEIVERHRMLLTHRVSLMLNTLRDDKTKGNGTIAKQIVDACLSEVF